jgi:secreted PhoX family phosphatase
VTPGVPSVARVRDSKSKGKLPANARRRSFLAEWVGIDDPDPDLEGGATPVALQGVANGGALFNRLEGIWYDERSKGFFFTSTSGGDAALGQVWHYDPRGTS